MAKNTPVYDVATMQPDELNELKKVVREYMDRKQNVSNEIETLKEDLKALDEEYEEKIDLKTLRSVERVLKIEAGVQHKHNYDVLSEALRDPTV
jgi:hypothetical protein